MPRVEFRVIEHSPQGCFFCRSSNGPFLDFMLSLPEVPTANGPIPLETEVHACIGSRENPGCMSQMARTAGGLDPFQWAAEREARIQEYGTLTTKIRNLEIELEDSRAKEGIRVVPVDEVLDAVRG